MLFTRQTHSGSVAETTWAAVRAPESRMSILENGSASAVEEFLPQHLTDRVVIALLFEEIITVEQVQQAWLEWERRKGLERQPLWRVLAEQPGVDVEAVRAAAARAYGFARAEVSPFTTLAFVEMHAHQFTGEQWQRMIELCVLPVAQRTPAATAERNRWVFATYDPLRPEVRQFLDELKRDRFELMYAPENVLVELFTFLFAPDDYDGLDELNTLERALQLPPGEDASAVVAETPSNPNVTFSEFFEELLVTVAQHENGELCVRADNVGRVKVMLETGAISIPVRPDVRLKHERFVNYICEHVLEAALGEAEPGQSTIIQRWFEDGLQHFEVRFAPQASERSEKKILELGIRALEPGA